MTHPHIRHEEMRPARRHALAVITAVVLVTCLPTACAEGLLDAERPTTVDVLP